MLRLPAEAATVALVLATLSLAPRASAQTATATLVAGGRFERIDLGTLGGGGGEAYWINAAGVIVGASETEKGDTRACVWERGAVTDLGLRDGEESRALAINERGAILGCTNGRTQDPGHVARSFLWEPPAADGTRRIVDLGTLGGGETYAQALSDAGVVVGWSITGDDKRRAFRWASGRMIGLDMLRGARGDAFAVTRAGVIGGTFGVGDEDEVDLCLWKDLRASERPWTSALRPVPDAMNEGLEIAGFVDEADGSTTAALFPGGAPVRLPGLGGKSSAAFGINAKGAIVGYASTASEGSHACLWERDASGKGYLAIDLASDADEGSNAHAIDDAGRIVGSATVRGAGRRPCLWRPVDGK